METVWSCDEKRNVNEHEYDGKETERKALVTMDPQHQQPPGGKEYQAQKCIKNGTVGRTAHNGRT